MPHQATRFGWSRRLGAAGALVLLVGVGITFAAGALNRGGGPGADATQRPRATDAAAHSAAPATPDAKPPVIRIARPDDGSLVYGATETLRGRTEAGATLTVTNERDGAEVPATVESDGVFEARLPLQMGQNSFVLYSRDAAGNEASTRLVVSRANSLASVTLVVSATEIAQADLPATLNAVAVVRDEQGAVSNDASAVFSLSPPNGDTATYGTTTFNGEARWQQMVVSGGGRAVGKWLVTVLVTLPSGEKLRSDASFTVR